MRLARRTGILKDTLTLYRGGTVLDKNDWTLGQYGFLKDVTLHAQQGGAPDVEIDLWTGTRTALSRIAL